MKQFLHQVGEALMPCLIAIMAFLAPIAGVLFAVGFFISADMIMARYRCYVKKVKWTSRKARAGLLPKIVSYNTVVISFFLLDKFVMNDFIHLFTEIPFALTKLLAMVLIWIELKSIDESFEAVKGKSMFWYLADMIKVAKKVHGKISDINEEKKEPDVE